MGKGVLIREHLSKSETKELPSCTFDGDCETGGCDVSYGCLKVHEVAACTDGDYCSTSDMCNAGICNETTVMNCDDGNPCTADQCVKGAGCYGIATKADEVCAVDKTCDVGGNCGNCPYIRIAVTSGKINSYAPLGSIDGGEGNFIVFGSWNANYGGGGIHDYVAKFTSDGKLLWDIKSVAEEVTSDWHGAALLADGGVLLAGRYSLLADYDGQMMRLDKDGKVVWKKIYVVPNTNQAFRGLNLSGGNAYFAGEDATKSLWGEVDLATGNILWQLTNDLGLGGADLWNNILKLTDGGWLLIGSSAYGEYGVAQRIDGAKKIKWTFVTDVLPIAFMTAGFIRGWVGSDGTFTAIGTRQTANGAGPLAVRLNAVDGKLLWQFLPKVTYAQVVTNGALLGDASLLLTGHASLVVGAPIGFVMRLDSNGKPLWLRVTALSNGNDDPYSGSDLTGLTPDPSGTWTVHGSSTVNALPQLMMQRFNLDGTFQCNP